MSWLKRGRDKNEGADPLAWVGDEPGPDERATGERAPDERAQAAEPGAEEPGERSGPVVGGPDDGAPAGDEPGERHGPWDVSEVEASDAYVDLGGLWIPGQNGMELRLEVEEESGRVIAVTVQLGDSAVQLQAFAAPRTSGIWDEIRKEIASSVSRQGGTADEVPGPFGRELLARVPTRTPEGRTAHQPARFAGVDGPRWFLRAVFHGEAAYEAEKATDLEALVQQVVVVRGTEAMAPRELLSLRLPESAGDGDDGPAEEETSASFRPPERGPEISEVR